MAAAFLRQSMPTPPWRQGSAMLARWQPTRYRDTPFTPIQIFSVHPSPAQPMHSPSMSHITHTLPTLSPKPVTIHPRSEEDATATAVDAACSSGPRNTTTTAASAAHGQQGTPACATAAATTAAAGAPSAVKLTSMHPALAHHVTDNQPPPATTHTSQKRAWGKQVTS